MTVPPRMREKRPPGVPGIELDELAYSSFAPALERLTEALRKDAAWQAASLPAYMLPPGDEQRAAVKQARSQFLDIAHTKFGVRNSKDQQEILERAFALFAVRKLKLKRDFGWTLEEAHTWVLERARLYGKNPKLSIHWHGWQIWENRQLTAARKARKHNDYSLDAMPARAWKWVHDELDALYGLCETQAVRANFLESLMCIFAVEDTDRAAM